MHLVQAGANTEARMECSSPEITMQAIPSVKTYEEWYAMLLHECFHGFQYKHADFWAVVTASNPQDFDTSDSLKALKQNYDWYRDMLSKENALLMKAYEASDIHEATLILADFYPARNERLKAVKDKLGLDIMAYYPIIETMEGSARYIEYRLAREQGVTDTDWMTNLDSNSYYYASGLYLMLIMDKFGIPYKDELFQKYYTLIELIQDKTSFRWENIGACVIYDDSIRGVHENERFAMHSVMKFPQALYVADYLCRQGLGLHDTIIVNKADLMQDTWSPMMKLFDGRKAFSYAELLNLSLGQSDNNACELLFKFCGKPKLVENYMRKLGFNGIHIRRTEKQMHKNPAKAIENNSSPTEMVRLFDWFDHHKDDNQYLSFIWKTMAGCKSGQKRIPAAIPADARIVHKTGTGFPSLEGTQDMNDAGIIIMPDGSRAIIAIFMTNSTSEAEVANVAQHLLFK